jgi:hypothetical protein
MRSKKDENFDKLKIKYEHLEKKLANEKAINQKLRQKMEQLVSDATEQITTVKLLAKTQEENINLRHKVFHAEAK